MEKNKYEKSLDSIKALLKKAYLPEVYKNDLENVSTIINRYTKQQKPKFIPCKCGCNVRRRWFSVKGIVLVCAKCGYQVSGKNEIEARNNWNKIMEEKTK